MRGAGDDRDPDSGGDPEMDSREDSEREIDELLSDGGSTPSGARPADRTLPAATRTEAVEEGSGAPPDRSSTSEAGADRDWREVEGGVTGGGVKLPFNYGALVGLVFALIIAVALFSLLTGRESGTVGIGDVGIGEKVAPFAVPIATSDLEGDANIDPDEACDVRGEDVLRICDYFDRPTVISFWFTTGASACIDQQDVFETVARRFGDRVNTVSINVRDDRERVRELIEQRDWQVTVGHDTDGAVSNIYRVGGCPTFLFVAPGGVLEKAEIGRTTVGELSAQVRSFVDGE